jgi:hypothetical protein
MLAHLGSDDQVIGDAAETAKIASENPFTGAVGGRGIEKPDAKLECRLQEPPGVRFGWGLCRHMSPSTADGKQAEPKRDSMFGAHSDFACGFSA